MYSRHPALLLDAAAAQAANETGEGIPGGAASEFHVTQFVSRDRVLDMAMESLRAGSRNRKDSHRSGYTSIAQFVDWFVEDVVNAVETEFPPTEVRTRSLSCSYDVHRFVPLSRHLTHRTYPPSPLKRTRTRA